jgi:hypothetical protein
MKAYVLLISGVELWLQIFLTSALDGSDLLTKSPGRLIPGKELQYPEAGWAAEPVDVLEKLKENFSLTGYKIRTVHYADYASWAPIIS